MNEISHTQIPMVEFKGPLMKGNAYTDYDVALYAQDTAHTDPETLKRLNALFPNIRECLSLVRSSTDLTQYHPLETDLDVRELHFVKYPIY